MPSSTVATPTNNAIVLSNEDRGAFEELVSAYAQRIQPTDPVEMRITRELASIDWLLSRNFAMDTRLLDHEMDIQAPSFDLENGPPPELTRRVLAGRSLVEKSRFPAYLAERQAKLILACRDTLRALESLRKNFPSSVPAVQIQVPQPLNPEIGARNEPETNPRNDPEKKAA